MADVSKIRLPNNTELNIKDARVKSEDLVYEGADMGDATYTDSGTVVDLSDYASKTWVENKSYARAIGTSGEFIKGDGSLDSTCYDPYIVGTQTAATNLWTGVAPFETLVAGQGIRYKLPFAGNSTAATLNLTLADGTTTTGAIPLRMSGGTGGITTHYAAGAVLYLTYDGETWRHDGDYDSTVNYQLRSYYMYLPMASPLYRYRLVFTSADNTHLVPADTSTLTDATSKRNVNQIPINPFGPIYYYNTTTAIAAGSNAAAATLYQQINGFTLGYSFNRTGSALSLTTKKPVYVRCIAHPDGSATIDADTPYVQDLPTVDDDRIYIYLGTAYTSATAIELDIDHPVYCIRNGAVVPYSPSDTMAEELTFTKRISPASSHDYFRLKSIKGNTIVWNQLVQNGDFSNGTTGWNFQGSTGSASEGIVSQTAFNGGNAAIYQTNQLIVSHKYLFSIFLKTAKATTVRFLYSGFGMNDVVDVNAGDWQRFARILTPTAIPFQYIYFYTNVNNKLSSSDTVQLRDFCAFDLTRMFGAGREPATVEEFERLFPLPYYEYEAGMLVSFNSTGIETIGRNLWDEQWEAGTYDSQNGNKLDNPTYAAGKIRNKNYISVFPSTTYYVNNANFMYWEYDESKRYIQYSSSSGKTPTNGVFTTGKNCYYINFRVTGTTYNNDICISLSDLAFNGNYEPYKKATIPLDVSSMTYDNGADDVFPFGVGSAGDVYDELIVDEDGYARRGIRRRAQVDLGMLNWTYSANYAYFTHNLTVMRGGGAMLCAKYNSIPGISDAAMATAANGTINNGNGTWLKIKDTAYSTAAAFKSAMNGVILCYELATPETYTLDTPIYVGSDFYKGGIQRVLPENEYDTIYTSPFRGSFEYSNKPNAATLKAIDDAVKIDVELYAERRASGVSITNTLYIRAKYGVIDPDTDNLIFIRHVAVRDYKNHGVKNQRRKGWIRPHYYNDILLNFEFDHIDSRSGLAYYRVFPGIKQYANSRFVQDYLSPDGTIHWYNSFKELRDDQNAFKQDHIGSGNGGFGPARLDRRCAMYVERNGKRISDYLRFSVHGQGNDIGIRVT